LWEKIKGVVIMINCPNCKRLIKENVKFCPYCGFKIKGYSREEEKVCPQCGTPYKEGQNFCKICGYDLDAMSKGDIVSVYGEAVSRKENEAIARYDTTMRTLDGGDYPINSGRALLIINDEDIYYLVEVEVEDGKLRGYILKEDAKKIYGDYWYYIRNKKGKIGWVYGGYVKINE
jgi:RNA polymerase subunit RPABC4/transcription elongation factor Spt4